MNMRIEYIWNDEDTPLSERHRDITNDELTALDNGRTAAAESRLGVTIPTALKQQMIVQDGGTIGGDYGDELPFTDRADWGNAVCDWVLPLAEWELASNDAWFDHCNPVYKDAENPVDGLDRLVIIARHAESKLCLDYRASGPHGEPKVVYIETTWSPIHEFLVADAVDELITALIANPRSS